MKLNCVIDGEVCALNEEGLPDFDSLQKPSYQARLVFYAFDLLWLDGISIMERPLAERKQILSDFLKGNEVIRYSQHFTDPVALFDKMKSLGVEGIVSKKTDSPYVPGQRGNNWYKTPTEMRQEYVIGGWVESDKGRPFASMLFGAYSNKKLGWVGHAGGGFKHKDMPGILAQMKKLEIKTNPFNNKVDYKGIVHWVKPQLVANFKFATFTKSGRIRKPAIFLGFRDDKPADTVVQEQAKPAPKQAVHPSTHPKKAPAAYPGSNWRLIEKQAVSHSDSMNIDGCSFIATDIERENLEGHNKNAAHSVLSQHLSFYHAPLETSTPVPPCEIDKREHTWHVYKRYGRQATGMCSYFL